MSKRENLGDAEKSKKLQARERDRQAERVADLHAVLELAAGRRFLGRLIASLKGDGAPLWAGNSEIHRTTARHDVGLQLEHEIKAHSPTLFRRLIAEQLLAEEKEEQLRSNVNTSNVTTEDSNDPTD